MAGRFTVLNDERIEAVRHVIAARMREAAARMCEEEFDEFFDATMRAVFNRSMTLAGAHEGTVWLLDQGRSFLVPRHNTGPNAKGFVGCYQQTLRSGMISMVVATEQPICENEVHKNQQQDRTLDQQLGLQTCAMLAVPFYFGGELRGVISAVQLKEANSAEADPPGFTADHLDVLQNAASVLSRLVEHQVLRLVLGLEELG